MSKEPEISFERIVVLNKRLRIPDARYKSGYRKDEVIAVSQAIIPEQYDGTTLAQNHIHKVGNRMVRTAAHAQVSFPLESFEQPL